MTQRKRSRNFFPEANWRSPGPTETDCHRLGEIRTHISRTASLRRVTPLTDQTPHTDPPRYWARSANSPRWQERDASPVRRFIGGSPVGVAVKLAVVSLLVGALLVWLNIQPAEVFREFGRLLDQLYRLGFTSIRQFGDYLIAGAVIVIPVWLILRLLAYRGR